jgi:hypothetical protein
VWRRGSHGTVTRSWTETVTREINPTDSTGPTTRRINVRVNYRYVVGSTAHLGDRVTFFPSTMSHGFAQLAREHRDRYAAGTVLDVRYDPRNPSDAVINELNTAWRCVAGQDLQRDPVSDRTPYLRGMPGRHHAFQHRAVLGGVHALRIRSDPAFRRAFGHGRRLRAAPNRALA